MTQQALRELVAKWREPLPERPEYVSEAMTDEERAESDGIAKLIETQKKICAEELEALLGEQREAQGATEHVLNDPRCITGTYKLPPPVLTDSMCEAFAESLGKHLNDISEDDGLPYDRKYLQAVWADIWSAPPLAESVGDVKALARELAESINFTDDRAQARVVFEKLLPDALRRHMTLDTPPIPELTKFRLKSPGGPT